MARAGEREGDKGAKAFCPGWWIQPGQKARVPFCPGWNYQPGQNAPILSRLVSPTGTKVPCPPPPPLARLAVGPGTKATYYPGTKGCRDKWPETKACCVVVLLLQPRSKTLETYLETSETLKIYACNMRFQYNVILLLRRMEARRHTELDAGAKIDACVEWGGCSGWAGAVPVHYYRIDYA